MPKTSHNSHNAPLTNISSGILPDYIIKEYIQKGIIKLDPLPGNWEELISEVSIDLHLGNTLKIFKRDGRDVIDTKYSTRDQLEDMMETITLKPGQPFVLTSEDFVIASTQERLTLPADIVGHLHGKSSLARIGVVVHSTAARFDPGWDGNPVLEFGTFLTGKKILLYPGQPICAFSFEKLASPVKRSYMNKPTRSFGGTHLPEVSNIAKSGGIVRTINFKKGARAG